MVYGAYECVKKEDREGENSHYAGGREVEQRRGRKYFERKKKEE